MDEFDSYSTQLDPWAADFAEHLRSGKTWAQARAAVVADQARHI
jgi:hypothetical protein